MSASTRPTRLFASALTVVALLAGAACSSGDPETDAATAAGYNLTADQNRITTDEVPEIAAKVPQAIRDRGTLIVTGSAGTAPPLRFYADDDLMVGAADPFQLFRIMYEVVRGGGFTPEVAFMLDQCHNIEAKIPAIIRSVMNVQEATAKALLVDGDALRSAQRAGDVLEANAVVMDAYNTDVRPLLREVREETNIEIAGITYFGSQPWPFPHQIMIGFTARYAGGTLIPDGSELQDARWFDRDALPLLPPPISIARKLVDAWLARSAAARR